MTMPYRLYTQLILRTLHGQDAANAFNAVDKWTNIFNDVAQVGKIKNYSLGGNVYNQWRIIFRPTNAPDFQSFPGLDEIAHVKIGVTFVPPYYNVKPLTSVQVTNGIITDLASPLAWSNTLVNGKYYDGVLGWATYPLLVAYCITWSSNWLTVASLPASTYIYEGAWNFGVGLHANSQQDNFWRNGVCAYYSDAVPNEVAWAANDGFQMSIVPHNMMVRYFNAVCNSLSRYSMTTAGGVPVVMTGLGFSNSAADVDEGGASKPGGWSDTVHVMVFEGLQGQGDYTFYVSPHVAPEYDVDSNTQITIATMPAMVAGTYQIKMRKLNTFHGTGKNIDSYAGDWRCDTDGRVYAGSRIIFTVGETDDDDEDDPVIYIEWPWKSRTTTIFKHWAPIDVRTPLIFYDGRILDIGSFERSPSDISGLAQVSDLTLEIANHDQEISKLLAEYECLNQTVSFWWGFRNSPYATKSYLCSMVVADYEKPDSTWKVTLRDINSRYF